MKIIFNNRREKSITVRVSNMAIPAGKSVLLEGGGTMTILQQIRGFAQVEQYVKMIWTCAEDSEYTGQKMLKMEMTSVRHIINSSQGECAPLSWFMMTASSLIPCSLTTVLKWSSTVGPASTVRPEEDRFSLVFYNTDGSYSVKYWKETERQC